VATTKRSWEDDESEHKNRGSMLALLGLGLMLSIGILAMLARQFFGGSPESWVAQINVAALGDDLPPIQTAWDAKDLIAAAESAGLRPWVPRNASQTRDINKMGATNLETDLKNLAGPEHPDDTLILLLRCHAAVTQPKEGTGEPWGCELLVGGSERLYLDRVLELLAENPYRNTLILADVCDLSYAPSRGWVLNPVASYIQQACKKLEPVLQQKNQHLWVLCSAADGQAPHVDRAGKSLFQEACSKAFGLANPQQTLSLAEYCDSIHRYCSSASLFQQTPVLFYANTSQVPCNPDSPSWQQARDVAINRKSARKTTADDLAENTSTTNASNVTEERTPKTDQAKKEPAESSSRGETAAAPIRFWDKIDRARGYTDGQGKPEWRWKPSDYAPIAWRQWILDQTARETPLEESVPDFEIDKRLGTNPARLAWELAPGHPLSPEEAEAWPRLRERFRAYIDAIGELNFWRDLAFTLPTPRSRQDRSPEFEDHLAAEFQRAVDRIDSMREQLHLDHVEQEWSGIAFHEGEVMDPFANMRAQLNQIIATLVKEEWSWSAEYRCSKLLQSPLLTSLQRQTLQDALQQKKIAAVKPTTEWSSGDDPGLLQRMQVFAACSAKMAPWYTHESALSHDALNSQEALLHWGQMYRQHHARVMQSLMGTMSSLQRWHYCSLMDLPAQASLDELASQPSSVLFYPGNPNRVSLTARCGSEGKSWIEFQTGNEPVIVRLRRAVAYPKAGMSSSDSFSLRWQPENLTARLIQLKVNSMPWPPGEMHQFSSDEARIEVRWMGPPNSELPVDAMLRFEHVGENARPQQESIALPIYLDAEAIGLVAVDARNARYQQPDVNDVLEITGPPIVQAERHLELYLQNNLPDRSRVARLRIHAAPSPSAATNPDRGPQDRGPLLAESTKVLLGQAVAGASRVKVTFVEREPDPKGTPLPPESLSELTCYVEEFAPPAVPSPAAAPGTESTSTGQPASNEKPAKIYTYRLKLRPAPLSDYLLRATPRHNSDDLPEIEFEMVENFWNDPRHPPIPIRVRGWKKNRRDEFDAEPLTTEQELASPDHEGTATLQPDTPRATLRLPMAGKDFDREFMVDVGGYPRARYFQLKPNPLQPGAWRLEGENFPPRISKPSLRALTLGATAREIQPVVDNASEPTLIFPNRDWGNDEERWSKRDDDRSADPIQYASLCVRVEPDGIMDGVGENGIRWQLSDATSEPLSGSDGDNPKPLDQGTWPDRTFFARPKFRESEVSLTFQVTELDQRIPFPDPLSKASKRLRLELSAGDARKKFQLIFDRQKPERGRLVVGPNKMANVRLSNNDRVTVDLIPQGDAAVLDRGGAGLKDAQVWLAIDENEELNPKRFLLNVTAKPAENALRFSIEGETVGALLKESRLGAGSYYLRARTYDRAGNVQSDHQPLTIDWVLPKPAP
jgi:hypothetical protein